MDGKIDFIVCEREGTWYITSFNVPHDIAVSSNPTIVEWAQKTHLCDDPDVIYVGVYWRDLLLDEDSSKTPCNIVEKILKDSLSRSN